MKPTVYEYMLSCGAIVGDDRSLAVKGRNVRGGSICTARTYLEGSLHANTHFAAKEALDKAIVDAILEHDGQPPFMLMKSQRMRHKHILYWVAISQRHWMHTSTHFRVANYPVLPAKRKLSTEAKQEKYTKMSVFHSKMPSHYARSRRRGVMGMKMITMKKKMRRPARGGPLMPMKKREYS